MGWQKHEEKETGSECKEEVTGSTSRKLLPGVGGVGQANSTQGWFPLSPLQTGPWGGQDAFLAQA